MKHKEIIEIVEDHFKKLEKLRHKILKNYYDDDIHDFRVSVKKLRAFLKMANIKKEADKPLISKLLKTFYGYIGILRNIHLQKQKVFKYTADGKKAVPALYIQLLTNEEDCYKKDTAELIKDNNFEDVKNKIIKALPEKIDKDHLKKFIGKLLKKLKKLLPGVKDDETIHSIRKILKDVLYTYPYIKNEPDLPKLISNKKKLKTITGLLGDYIDKYIELKYLAPGYLNKINNPIEKKLLLQIQTTHKQEKRLLKQKLHYRFNMLKMQLT